jgi:hypothetical protein
MCTSSLGFHGPSDSISAWYSVSSIFVISPLTPGRWPPADPSLESARHWSLSSGSNAPPQFSQRYSPPSFTVAVSGSSRPHRAQVSWSRESQSHDEQKRESVLLSYRSRFPHLGQRSLPFVSLDWARIADTPMCVSVRSPLCSIHLDFTFLLPRNTRCCRENQAGGNLSSPSSDLQSGSEFSTMPLENPVTVPPCFWRLGNLLDRRPTKGQIGPTRRL